MKSEIKTTPLVPGLIFVLIATVIFSMRPYESATVELGERLMTLAGTVPCLAFLIFGRTDS